MPYPLGHEGDWRKRETKKRNQPCFFQHCLEWFIFTSLHVEANMLTSPAPLFFLRPKVRNARVRSPSLRPRGICFCLKNAKLISAESGEIGQWQPTTWKCEEEKKNVRRPGIEPGSQEWESCMIPLHQRRSDIPVWIFEKSTNLPKEFCQLCTTLDGLLPASLLVESSFLCTHSPASSVGRAWDS